MKLADVACWPVATDFSLGPDVSFRGKAEVGQAAEYAASVESDPKRSFSLWSGASTRQRRSWQAVTSRAAVGPDPRVVEWKN